MAISIQHKRGVLANRPSLAAAEFYYATDTDQWFYGATPLLLGNLTNFSTADQTINAATTALLTGSLITIPAGGLRIGTVFLYRFSVSKTAAGTATNAFNFRIGTAGTTSDTSICAFTVPAGTAVADVGFIDVMVTIRGPLSSSCIAQGNLRMTHNLSATGLATVPCVSVNTTSAAFNATTAGLKASLSCTTGSSTVLTFQQVVTEVLNLR